MSVQKDTAVTPMPHVLTLMVASPAPAEMEMLVMASAVKVSIPALFRHEMNMCDYETTLFSAQCATNFQLVLGPVDSCLNWRVSLTILWSYM